MSTHPHLRLVVINGTPRNKPRPPAVFVPPDTQSFYRLIKSARQELEITVTFISSVEHQFEHLQLLDMSLTQILRMGGFESRRDYWTRVIKILLTGPLHDSWPLPKSLDDFLHPYREALLAVEQTPPIMRRLHRDSWLSHHEEALKLCRALDHARFVHPL